VALAQPVRDISPGSWSLALTCNSAAPPAAQATPRTAPAAPAQGRQSAVVTTAASAAGAGGGARAAAAPPPPPVTLEPLPSSRVVSFDGVYSRNAAGVAARYVLSATAPVNMALLASVGPLPAAGKARLRLLDARVAKEVAWSTAGYGVIAEATADGAGADGACSGATAADAGSGSTDRGCKLKLSVPSVMLPAGRFVALLEIEQPGGFGSGEAGVKPTGAAQQQQQQQQQQLPRPPVTWQLQVLPGGDEKVCAITKDDAFERYLKSQLDIWQQQAAAVSAAATAALAAASPAAAVGGAAATTKPPTPPAAGGATKDRAKAAAAALERHLAAEARPVATQGAGAPAPTPPASAPSSAVGRRRAGTASSSGAAGGGPDGGAAGGGNVRHLKGPGGMLTAVALAPESAVVVRIAAGAVGSGGAGLGGQKMAGGGKDPGSAAAALEARKAEIAAFQTEQVRCQPERAGRRCCDVLQRRKCTTESTS
jgi:hypothetical protein